MDTLALAFLFAMLDPSVSTKIDTDVATVLANLHIPGATIEITRGGVVEYRKAYGLRDLRDDAPAESDTHYEIGSITKQFTAAAILRLHEEGLVDLDATVAAYLPRVPHAAEITVRQCLDHTSGLPDYLDAPDIEKAFGKAATFDSVMARVAGKPLEFAPGSNWAYSNTGYIILGRIIEVVSKQSYERYVRTQFLQPLGMNQTFTVADEARILNMAVGYRHVDGVISPAPVIPEAYAFSAGDLVSTVDDLQTWSAALEGGRVVPRADYSLMTAEQRTTKGTGTGYGFGLFVDSIDGQPRIGHTGGTFGSTSADEYFPNQDVRVIAFTNDADGNPEGGETITTAIFEDLYPKIAEAASRSAGGSDASITSKTRAFFRSMQAGSVDTDVLTQRLQTKFESGVGKRLAKEYAPYGDPTDFIFKGKHVTSGVVWYAYDVRFGPGVMLDFGIGIDSAGKIAGLSFG